MMLRVEVRGIRTLAAFKLAQSNVSKTGLQFMLMIILYMIPSQGMMREIRAIELCWR